MPLDADAVRAHLHERDLRPVAEGLRDARVDELLALLDELATTDAAVVFRLLGKQAAVEVLDRLDARSRTDLVAVLGHEEVAAAFRALDADEQARLLDELPATIARRLIATIDDERLEPVMAVLGYPAGSVGRRMEPTTVRLLADDSVDASLAALRATADVGAAVPVLEDDRVLVGLSDAHALLRGDPAAPTRSVAAAAPVVATTSDDAERIARLALDRGALLVPVLDAERRLVGVLPIADAARIDRDAVAEDQARSGGSEPLRRPYLLTPVRTLTRSRIVWLLVLAVSAVLTVHVLELFEATLEQQVALALFIPLLTGIGGNTGSQAATTVTRALAVGDVQPRDVLRVAGKEVRTGMLLGLGLALLAFAIASLVYGWHIGAVLGIALALNCPIAATVGGVVPLAARACRVDPAVLSTPFITTFCDASGLVVYFLVAIAVLPL